MQQLRKFGLGCELGARTRGAHSVLITWAEYSGCWVRTRAVYLGRALGVRSSAHKMAEKTKCPIGNPGKSSKVRC